MNPATQFLRRLGAVPEPAMRAALWRERLAATPPEDAVALLEVLFVALDRAEPDARMAWLALLGVVEELRGGPLATGIYAAARVAGATRVQALWLQGPPPPPPQRQNPPPPPPIPSAR